MRDRKTIWISFAVGAMVCAWPAWDIWWDRTPAVHTTRFEMTPSTVKPGEEMRAVWTEETLRIGQWPMVACEGEVYRRFSGIKDGEMTFWSFGSIRTVHHGRVGEVQTFRTQWRAPDADPGTEVLFEKSIKRWCNIWQWFAPMHERQEAKFMMAK